MTGFGPPGQGKSILSRQRNQKQRQIDIVISSTAPPTFMIKYWVTCVVGKSSFGPFPLCVAFLFVATCGL